MSTLYQRRIEQEWRLLKLLAGANQERLQAITREDQDGAETFGLILHETTALFGRPGAFQLRESHEVIFHFPMFFPSVPIEASLRCPAFHPNVHPENGFVCLWSRFSSGDTVIEAVRQLQQVISWSLVNQEADHVMQPDALAWYTAPSRQVALPLTCRLVTRPVEFQAERTYASRPRGSYRRRLE